MSGPSRVSLGLWRAPLAVRAALGAVFAVFALWVGATVYLHFNPYYAISPGDALAVSTLVNVPADRSHAIHGSILLTDVYLGPVSAAQLPGDLLDPYVDLEPQVNVLGPGGTPSQLSAISAFQMQQSQDDAKIAALSHVGMPVTVRGKGALVIGVIPHMPASSAIKPDDVITAVDGVQVAGPAQLKKIVNAHRPDEAVTLTVQAGIDGPVRTVHTHLGSGGNGPGARPLIGVEVYPDPVETYRLPFPISINSDQIGGPSAGLAFSLGVIDALSNGNLGGGTKIAATGEIDQRGNVAPIGGLPQKTVAVRRAGATVFFVPYGQSARDYAQARRNANGKVRIVKVHSLTDALTYLHRIGGDMQGVSIQPVTSGSSPGTAPAS